MRHIVRQSDVEFIPPISEALTEILQREALFAGTLMAVHPSGHEGLDFANGHPSDQRRQWRRVPDGSGLRVELLGERRPCC